MYFALVPFGRRTSIELITKLNITSLGKLSEIKNFAVSIGICERKPRKKVALSSDDGEK